MGISEWTFSRHAVERALDMALDADELRLALIHPEYTRHAPLTKPEYEGCRIHIRGRLSVVVDPASRVVITVIWYKQFKSGDTTRRRTAQEDEEFFRDNN